MFVTNWNSTTKIQKISEITNFFRHYFLSRTEVYCLTNWSHETFPIVKEVHARLFGMFEGIVVSGEEKLVKPNPEIYQLLLNRYSLQASESIFIDDRQVNVDGANHVGIHGILFTGAQDLKQRLCACLQIRHF